MGGRANTFIVRLKPTGTAHERRTIHTRETQRETKVAVRAAENGALLEAVEPEKPTALALVETTVFFMRHRRQDKSTWLLVLRSCSASGR